MRTKEFRELWERKYPGGTVQRGPRGLALTFETDGKLYLYGGENWQIAERLGIREPIDVPTESRRIVRELAVSGVSVSYSMCSDTVRMLWVNDGWIESEPTGESRFDHQLTRFQVSFERNAWL